MSRFLFSLYACLLLVAAPARAAGLRGRVVDALDGRPIAGAVVSVVGMKPAAASGADGSFNLPLPAGVFRLKIAAAGYRTAFLANQHSTATAPISTAHLWPLLWPSDFTPGVRTFGVGYGSGLGPEPRGPVRLPRSPFNAQVPAALPTSIRVARYFTTGCSGSYQRIDTIDFEDYVKGVVNAEVGVFHGVQGGPQSAAECWKAFSVAARSYALHFILTQPYDGYDVNDTACNQVYKDDRDPDVSAAVEATRGLILVKAQDQAVIDRYFYAASCAHHGSEPAYRSGSIIPDPTSSTACVGSWCGHTNCAGHADNPDLPGDDKCLVWGTCQWGSIERSIDGQAYTEILAHYQPDCSIIDLSGPDGDDGGTDAGVDAGVDAGADVGQRDSDNAGGGCECGAPGRIPSVAGFLIVLFGLLAWKAGKRS
ncbi:MAG TPA: SpoIID/LytB domain-containing protein [Myxococcota bacterium]|nr:SpoIID/LytB domain-containing protein [Myxococcota bacterium]